MILETNFESLSRESRRWALVLMLVAVVFSPIYVYASGVTQPAHVVMLLASVALIFLNRNRCQILIRENWLGVLFLGLVALINIAYAAYYQDKEFIVNTVYWLYGYLLLLAIILVARDAWVAVWTARFIGIALLLVVLSYVLGWGGYTYWPRYEYFFNGPNQLAYYAICLFLVYVAVRRGKLSLDLYATYALMIFLVITTGGRSAYLAVAPIAVLLLWMSRKSFLKMGLVLLISCSTSFIFEPLCLPAYKPAANGNQYVDCHVKPEPGTAESRFIASDTVIRMSDLSIEKEVTDNKSVHKQLLARGYLRFIDSPQYLLYGAGQGRDERFGEVDGYVYEIHSSVMAVVFYYGILGLLLFLAFVWKLFLIKRNLFFMTPLFVYGLFTYGLRAPYFWIALGFLALMPSLLMTSEVAVND
ncbi:hypothetical protein [Limnohabitans sp.]